MLYAESCLKVFKVTQTQVDNLVSKWPRMVIVWKIDVRYDQGGRLACKW